MWTLKADAGDRRQEMVDRWTEGSNPRGSRMDETKAQTGLGLQAGGGDDGGDDGAAGVGEPAGRSQVQRPTRTQTSGRETAGRGPTTTSIIMKSRVNFLTFS